MIRIEGGHKGGRARRLRGWLRLAWATTLLAGLASDARASELVRIRFSQFDGTEPATISSVTHPQLFVLDGAIASVELTAPFKDVDDDPGEWLPVMSPPPADPAGAISVRVTPQPGSPVSFGAISFATFAKFERNPSSLRLRWSVDAFNASLALIDMVGPRSTAVGLPPVASDEPVEFLWIAGNDFGEFGGGQAGFSGEDLVVYSELCGATPATGCAAAGRSSLKMVGNTGPTKQTFAWAWSKGTASIADFGDPLGATLLGLCLYEDGLPRMQLAIAPSGTCGTKPCWKSLPTGAGFAYREAGGNTTGVVAVKLKEGSGTAAISLRGKGARLQLPLPLSGPGEITAQLVRADGSSCFEAVYPTPAIKGEPFKFIDAIP